MPALPIIPGAEAAFARMTRELVDYRLATYRARRPDPAHGQAFECLVTYRDGDPILEMPPGENHPELPRGDTDVRLPDGSVWSFRFE